MMYFDLNFPWTLGQALSKALQLNLPRLRLKLQVLPRMHRRLDAPSFCDEQRTRNIPDLL
jgi:hypothetical protein